MKKFKVLALVAIMLTGLTAASARAFSNVSLTVAGPYLTGAPAAFTVTVNEFAPSADVYGIVYILNSSPADINSLQVLQNGAWSNLSLSPSAKGLEANIGSLSDVMSFRVNFKTTQPNILAFSLINNATGSTLSSASAPITVVQGSAVLGTSVYVFTRNLQYGSRGADVSELQNLLTSLGFYQGPVTGFYGSLTREAVRQYQASKNLPAIGIFGPLTRKSLSQ